MYVLKLYYVSYTPYESSHKKTSRSSDFSSPCLSAFPKYHQWLYANKHSLLQRRDRTGFTPVSHFNPHKRNLSSQHNINFYKILSSTVLFVNFLPFLGKFQFRMVVYHKEYPESS